MARDREFRMQEVTPPLKDGRVWQVDVVPDGIAYTVTATGRSLNSTPIGTAPIDRDWSEPEIQAGIRRAIERDLVSPPAKQRGQAYKVNVTDYDLYEAAGRL